MSDSSLSQDELDALLQGGTLENNNSETLTNTEEVTLSRLYNSLAVSRINIIKQSYNLPVSLDQVNILVGGNAKITQDLTSQLVGATSTITGSSSGEWYSAIPVNSVLGIINTMDNTNITEFSDDILKRFGDFIKRLENSDQQILSEQLKEQTNISTGEISLYTNGTDFLKNNGSFVRIVMNININNASYPFYIITNIRSAKNMARLISLNNNTNQTPNPLGQNNSSVNMQPASFQHFSPSGTIEPLDNLALLLDVPMRVTVELGRTRMTIKDILNLGEGSIVELEKLAGEPVDVLVNDKLIALGEVVVIDENFSVRVTKVVTPMERIFDRENLHGKGGF
ncbi:MAG: flagellar motor switch protein FliN [Brevinemataceae bacterium]